jgi:hypothetical protein
MMVNYFKTAFRSFKRNKGFTFLNITGFTIGLVVNINNKESPPVPAKPGPEGFLLFSFSGS